MSLREFVASKKWITPFPVRAAKAWAVIAISCASCNVSDCRNAKPHCRTELMSEKSASGAVRDTWRTNGYCASLYRWGIELSKTAEVVVAETSLPC